MSKKPKPKAKRKAAKPTRRRPPRKTREMSTEPRGEAPPAADYETKD